MRIIHDGPESSHPGKEKTYKQAQIKYFWIHLGEDIYDYVANCQKCTETKVSTRSPAPMLNYKFSIGSWNRAHIDTLELPTAENGFTYLFVAKRLFR